MLWPGIPLASKGTGIATVLPATPLHQRRLSSHRALLSGEFPGPEWEHCRTVHAAAGPASSASGGRRVGGAGRGRRLGSGREEEGSDFGGSVGGGRLAVLLE